MTRRLHPTGPLETFAEARALSEKAAFLDALGGPAVLVRLDERGGHDEPATWAFHGVPRTRPQRGDGPRDDDQIVASDIERVVSGGFVPPPIVADDDDLEPLVASPEDDTLTSVPPPLRTLPIPPARGAATVLVVPPQGQVTLGRDETADVVLRERSVSKRHAALTAAEAKWTLADLGSSNGTKINGRQVSDKRSMTLKSGDVIALGDVESLFLMADAFWEHLPEMND